MKLTDFAKKYTRDNYASIAAGNQIDYDEVLKAFHSVAFRSAEDMHELYAKIFVVDDHNNPHLDPYFVQIVTHYFHMIRTNSNSPVQTEHGPQQKTEHRDPCAQCGFFGTTVAATQEDNAKPMPDKVVYRS